MGTQMEGRVATSPNAYDDIVQELERRRLQRDHPRDAPEPRLALAARRPRRADRPPRLSAHDRRRHALRTVRPQHRQVGSLVVGRDPLATPERNGPVSATIERWLRLGDRGDAPRPSSGERLLCERPDRARRAWSGSSSPTGLSGSTKQWSELMRDAETPLLTHLALVFNALGHGILRGLTSPAPGSCSWSRAGARPCSPSPLPRR